MLKWVDLPFLVMSANEIAKSVKGPFGLVYTGGWILVFDDLPWTPLKDLAASPSLHQTSDPASSGSDQQLQTINSNPITDDYHCVKSYPPPASFQISWRSIGLHATQILKQREKKLRSWTLYLKKYSHIKGKTYRCPVRVWGCTCFATRKRWGNTTRPN